MRDTMIFYRSFYDAIKTLSKEEKADIYEAIFEYGLNMNEIELQGIPKVVFGLVKPVLDSNIKNYVNGSKPKKKRSGSQTEAKPKPSGSEMEAYKDKDVDKDKEVDKYKDDDKDVISTNILGDFDRKKFHHNNIREIEHIRNMDNISLDEAIDLHYDALQAIKSVFG